MIICKISEYLEYFDSLAITKNWKLFLTTTEHIVHQFLFKIERKWKVLIKANPKSNSNKSMI